MSNKQIVEYVKDHPDASTKSVMEVFKCKAQHVYLARYEAGVTKKNVKLRARNNIAASKDTTIRQLNKQIKQLLADIDILKTSGNSKSEIHYIPTPDQLSLIPKLEKDLVAANAIIAYLESKLHGTSV